MADNKKFYWLKLREDFFGDKEIKKLRKLAGGDTYMIIYLKLMLLSLRENGRLYFEGVEEQFYEELALEIDEDSENVKVVLLYLHKMGLMEEISDVEIFLTQIPECVGSETDKAALMRKSRARKKALEPQGGNDVTAALPPVTECYPEIREKREEIRFHSFFHSANPEPQDAVENFVESENAYVQRKVCDSELDGKDAEIYRNEVREGLRRRFLSGKLGQDLVFMSDEQFEDICNRLSLDEIEKYFAIIVDCERAGKHYKKKSHYQAILDMAIKDRRIKP